MNKSKAAIAKSRTVIAVQMVATLVIFPVSGLFTVMYLTDRDIAADMGVGFFLLFLALDALSIFLLVSARKKFMLLKQFKRYVAAVSNVPNGSIPLLAAYLGVPESEVRENLETMIKNKYFANASIDSGSNCVVIANRQNTAADPTKPMHPDSRAYTVPGTSQSIEMVTVKCKGCGGINTLQRGMVGVCDYCGSSIKGE